MDDEGSGYEIDELDFQFELLNDDDLRVITLVCTASRPLAPDEYACALMAFAERIESLATMAEVSTGTMN